MTVIKQEIRKGYPPPPRSNKYNSVNMPSILTSATLILLSWWLEFFVGGFGTVSSNLHLWTPHSLLKYRSFQLTGAAEVLGQPLCPPHIPKWLASQPLWDVQWKQRHEDSRFLRVFLFSHRYNSTNVPYSLRLPYHQREEHRSNNRRMHKNFEILKYRETFQISMHPKTRKFLFFLQYKSVCIQCILCKYINFLDNNLSVIKLRFSL